MSEEYRAESSVESDTVKIIPTVSDDKDVSCVESIRTSFNAMNSAGVSRLEVLLGFAVVGILSLVAVILSGVAIGRPYGASGNSDTSVIAEPGDDYVWTFAAGHSGHALEYIDEDTGQLRGFSVDLIDAVCKEANKNCEVIWDLYENCWDSEAGKPAHGGVGLLGGWYDACAAWVQTRDRLNTFKFSKPFFQKSGTHLGLFTSPSNSAFDWRNLTGRTVGFLDGWFIDDACLLLYHDEIKGFKKSSARHFTTVDDFIRAIKQNEVDCGFTFVSEPYRSELQLLTIDGMDQKCAVAPNSVMTRKDNSLTLWWNEAFDRVRANGKYREVCNDLSEEHGYPESRSWCLDD